MHQGFHDTRMRSKPGEIHRPDDDALPPDCQALGAACLIRTENPTPRPDRPSMKRSVASCAAATRCTITNLSPLPDSVHGDRGGQNRCNLWR